MKKELSKKYVKASQATLSALMTPEDQNFYGFVFGGTILKLMDYIAYICAKRHYTAEYTTASFDRVDFKAPIHIGELITLMASVNYVGNSSLEIGIKVVAEDLETKKIRHTNSGYVTMVAIDKNRKPIKIPKITPQTTTEKRRYQQAEKRYLARKK